jgi:hypothetical protein
MLILVALVVGKLGGDDCILVTGGIEDCVTYRLYHVWGIVVIW